ncbi:MAG: CBO0543 family protein [Deltaproteobacteria bacterium]
MKASITQSIHQAQIHLTQLQYQQWDSHLFSDNWWILLATLLLPWVLWWFLVKKERLFEILTFALLVIIIGTTLDVYGVNLGWWSYGTKLFYLNPGLIAGDWSLPPVCKSLIYQYFPDWPRFTAAIIILSALLSFALEPVLHLRGVYIMYHWSYLESFLVYLAVALLTKFIVDVLKKHIPA